MIFAASIGYFLWIGAYELTLFRAYGEAAGFIIAAQHILECVQNGNFELAWLLMESFYCGWALAYLLAFIMLFGSTTLFVCLFLPVILVAAGLCAMVWVLSRWFNFYVATLVCVLLVFDINFVRASRDAYPALEVVIFALFWMTLAFFIMGLERRKLRYPLFAACGFVCGFGCWVKLSFFCYLVPAVLFLVLTPYRVRRSLFGNTLQIKKLSLVMFGFFLLAFSPVIYSNINPGRCIKGTRENSINSIIRTITENSHHYDNKAVFHNVIARIWDFVSVLRGDMGLADEIMVPLNNFYPWMFLAAAIFLIFYMIFALKPVFSRRILCVIALFYVGVLLTLCYVPGESSVDPLLLLHPFPELVCALAFYCVAVCVRPVIVPFVLIAVLLIPHLSININRGITFFANMKTFFVSRPKNVLDSFAVRQIMEKRKGCLYYPARLGSYLILMDTDTGFSQTTSPIEVADALFADNIIHKKKWSLVVSHLAEEQIFKQRILELSRKAGYRIEEKMLIRNKKPEYSYQLYNVSRCSGPVSDLGEYLNLT